MHTASQALAIERQASAQTACVERVSRPKTRAILGLMRLNFLSVVPKRPEDARLHLAIAQVLAGQTDKAKQTFATVSGSGGMDDLVRYWLLAIRKP